MVGSMLSLPMSQRHDNLVCMKGHDDRAVLGAAERIWSGGPQTYPNREHARAHGMVDVPQEVVIPSTARHSRTVKDLDPEKCLEDDMAQTHKLKEDSDGARPVKTLPTS